MINSTEDIQQKLTKLNNISEKEFGAKIRREPLPIEDIQRRLEHLNRISKKGKQPLPIESTEDNQPGISTKFLTIGKGIWSKKEEERKVHGGHGIP